MLLDQFTLLDLTTYQGRKRTYVQDPDSPISNMGNTVAYEDFTIEAARQKLLLLVKLLKFCCGLTHCSGSMMLQ